MTTPLSPRLSTPPGAPASSASGEQPQAAVHLWAALLAEVAKAPERARAAYLEVLDRDQGLAQGADQGPDQRSGGGAVLAVAHRRLARIEEQAGNLGSAERHLEQLRARSTEHDAAGANTVISARHEAAAFFIRQERHEEALALLEADRLGAHAPRALLLGHGWLVSRLLTGSHVDPRAVPLGWRSLELLADHPDRAIRGSGALLALLCSLAHLEASDHEKIARCAEIHFSVLRAGDLLPRSSLPDLHKLAQRLTSLCSFAPGARAWQLVRREMRRSLDSRHPTALAAAVGLARCLDRTSPRRAQALLRGVITRVATGHERAAHERAGHERTDTNERSGGDLHARRAAVGRSASVYLEASLQRASPRGTNARPAPHQRRRRWWW